MDKKPWPRDAVMIVASPPEEAEIEKMEAIWGRDCRDCGRRLWVDTKTVREVFWLPVRRGRPIKFFCPECATRYDFDTINHFKDNRRNG